MILKYPCYHCEYKAKAKSNLKNHIESVHISKYSRAVIDLNRNLQEIDKRLIADDIKIDADETLKVKSGIDLIPVQTLKVKIIFIVFYKI